MEKKFDFLGFGEAMVRFSPPDHQRFEQAEVMRLAIAAAELNCCVNISTLGLKTKWVSKMCDNWVGRYVQNKGREHNVNMDGVKIVPYDGSGRVARNGLCFVEVGIGPRPNTQLYDRGHSAVSQMEPDELDWKALMSETRWYHTTGITCAISEKGAASAIKSLKTAKELGVTTSFDLNFRSTLWSAKQAQQTMKEVIPYVDFLIGNEEDTEKMLGIKADNTESSYAELEAGSYENVARKVCEAYPNVRGVGTTLRNAKTGLLNDWQVVMLREGKFYASRKYENLEILDRTGGGDSFASALIYSFLTNEFGSQDAIEFAAAYSALCHGYFGDWNWARKEEAVRVMKGGNARVIR